MNHLPFTPEQEQALDRFLKGNKSPKERERAKALLALQRGAKRKEVAKILDLNPATISAWKASFIHLGVDGIHLKPYPGNHRKLTKDQKSEIRKLITNQTPMELGYSDKRFWTTKALRTLVKDQFGVLYDSPYTYQRLFASCGFTCHKPGRHNRNQNQHLVERFRVGVKKRSDGTEGWAVWSW